MLVLASLWILAPQDGFLAPRRTAETQLDRAYEELVLADLTGDGAPDFAGAYRVFAPTPSRIDVRIGDGAGGFAPLASYALDGSPSSLRAGDVDMDGDLDLVWLEQSSAATGTFSLVHARLNGGAGAFGPEVTSSTNAKGLDQLELGDLNADGRLDALVGNNQKDPFFTSSFVPMLQHAPGKFAPGTPFTMLSERVPDFLLEDFDGDGDLDVASVGLEALGIAHNQGAGTFEPAGNAFFPGLGLLENLVFGPVLEAGENHFAVVAPGGVHYAEVTPAGTPKPLFLTQEFDGGPIDLAQGWSDAELLDADGDGRDEILVMAHAMSGGEDRWGYVTGTDAADLRVTSGWNTSSALADVDGDGLTDVAMVSWPSDTLLVVFGEPGAFALPTGTVPDGWAPTHLDALAVADHGLDGAPDLAALDTFVDTFVLVADSAAGPAALLVPHFAKEVDPVDFDGDGNSDLVVTPGAASHVQIFLGDGSGGFAPPISSPDETVSAVDPRFVDVDGDGDLDLVYGHSSPQIRIHLGDGAGGLLPWSAGGGSIPTQGDAVGLDAGDVDGDGAVDLVTANGFEGTYEVLLGDGAAGFVSSGLAPVGGKAYDVRLVDLDGDHDLDLLLGCEGSFRVLANDGAGAFVEIAAHAVPGFASGFAATDLDADGRGDLAVNVGGRMHLFRGTPAGYVFERSVPTGVYTQDFQVLDLDADGRNDLVAISESYLSVLRGLDAAQPGVSTFGTGTGGCRGRMGVSASTPPAVGNAAFGLACTNAPASTNGVFAVGVSPHAQGLSALGVLLHVVPAGPLALFPASADPGGTGWVPLPIPAQATLAGHTVYGQVLWLGWPASECKPSGLGFTTSPGVALTFLP